jgi:protocatechuate 3,4-dioxygenase beta subunit
MAHASSRRRFLHGLAWSAPALPLLRLPLLAAGTNGWQTVLVGPGEPGQPLVVSGRVVDASGSPRPGIRIDVYHTDAAGYYSRPVSDPRRARIRGSVTTDRQGRYEVRTIKPGSYHDRPQAAHIHVHLSGDGHPEHWVDSFLFAGDPYLPASDLARSRQAGRFAHVLDLHPRAGVLHATRDFRLDAQVAQRNRLVDGWYR